MVSLVFRSARAPGLAVAALLAAIVGCGGSTEDASSTGGGAGVGAGTSTGVHMDEVATSSVTSTGTSQHAVSAGTGTTTGSNGTAMTTGAGGAGGGETMGTGGAGGDACDGAYLSVNLQDSSMTTYMLTESCPGHIDAVDTPHALAYEGYTSGGPNSMHELSIDACDSVSGAHFGADVPLFAPGTNDTDSANFDVDHAHLQTTNGLTFTLTALGAVGGAVVGSYSGTLVDDTGAPVLVNGDFKLCRASDFLPP
jgi:hypothetical protein